MTETPALPEQRKRPIPKRVREAITLIVEGRARTIAAAARKVSMSREGLSRALSHPAAVQHLKERAAKQVALGAGRAAARLIQLLDAKSEHVAAEMTKHTLAIAGIKPASDAQVNVNLEVRAGYVICLTDPNAAGDAKMKVVSPQPAAVAASESTER